MPTVGIGTFDESTTLANIYVPSDTAAVVYSTASNLSAYSGKIALAETVTTDTIFAYHGINYKSRACGRHKPMWVAQNQHLR